jgi:hypothetical protein
VKFQNNEIGVKAVFPTWGQVDNVILSSVSPFIHDISRCLILEPVGLLLDKQIFRMVCDQLENKFQ